MTTFLQQTPIVIATVAGIAVFVFVAFLGWLTSKKLEIELGAFYNLFSAFLGIYVWLELVYSYGFLGSWNIEIFLLGYAGTMIFWGVWYFRKVLAIVVWDWYLMEYRKMQIPALVRSLVTVLILITTILLIIRYVFGQDLSGLLVASSVVAAVIAFALQDFLGGLIAGISLNIQPPFEVGDWIRVIDKEGEVIDVNWRATTMRTIDRTYLVVPNSIITKEEIVNFYEPTRLHALQLSVGVEYDAPPSLVKDTLISCAVDTDGIRNKPQPQCRLTNFGDFAITYTIKCYIDDHTLSEEIKDGIMTRIWYALKRKGIKIPFPIRDVYTHEAADRENGV
ncbi:MAG: mechanosensitive ion channel family protein [Balneolaceae bacterium]|nr:mechanosensitive ion channel family protein [Balneolaceae bacterium]